MSQGDKSARRSASSKLIARALRPLPNQRAADVMLAKVRASGLKLTPQRLAIVREIASDPTHPTAQELYERLLPSMPTMSFATVYNTLDALAAAGLCSARALAPGPSRFDPNMVAHDHAVCDSCGLVRDVTSQLEGPQHEGSQHEGPQHEGSQHEVSQHEGKREPAARAESLRDEHSMKGRPRGAGLQKLGTPIPGFSVHAVEQIYRGVCADCEKNRSAPRRKSEPQAVRGAAGAAASPARSTPHRKSANA